MKKIPSSMTIGTIALAIWMTFTAIAEDQTSDQKKKQKTSPEQTPATQKTQDDSSKAKALPLKDVKMTSRESNMSESEEAYRRRRRYRRRWMAESEEATTSQSVEKKSTGATSQEATMSEADKKGRRKKLTEETSEEATTLQSGRRRRRGVTSEEATKSQPAKAPAGSPKATPSEKKQ